MSGERKTYRVLIEAEERVRYRQVRELDAGTYEQLIEAVEAEDERTVDEILSDCINRDDIYDGDSFEADTLTLVDADDKPVKELIPW